MKYNGRSIFSEAESKDITRLMLRWEELDLSGNVVKSIKNIDLNMGINH